MATASASMIRYFETCNIVYLANYVHEQKEYTVANSERNDNIKFVILMDHDMQMIWSASFSLISTDWLCL